ncbi:MAG: formate dehydrogenase accessory sulfurtransferase FdhD [Thiothrix sp.]|nr:formate dehydrogenase accessory sulfurtransferase FdhD [Thiothrix sp.]HPE59082.1 formate dehydrogenase accessory sulfurtransferase FdhD [Thiolinea sp.]
MGRAGIVLALPSSPPAAVRTLDICLRRGEQQQALQDQVAEECAVALVYNGIPHVVMMVSPQQLDDFVLGFSLSEGIINHPDELLAMENHCRPQGIVMQIRVPTACQKQLQQRRRNLAGRTGCGLCGAESLQQALPPVPPVTPRPLPTAAAIQTALLQLPTCQPLQALTGAMHGAAWCSARGDILLLREDVGRHNALDKLLGALQRQQDRGHGLASETDGAGFVLVSSRASYEMVQKVCSHNIGSLVALSAPTALAVERAQAAGLNLVAFAREARHVIYTNPPASALEVSLS